MGNIVKTIGSSGRDYSTVQAWEDALPANLVTDGNSQEGRCYNDSEFSVAGPVVTFSGCTTDATHGILLTTGAGQSFRDNQPNALRYNQAVGVGLKCTAAYNDAVQVFGTDITIRGLQISNVGGGGSDRGINVPNFVGASTVIEDCIVENDGQATATSNDSGVALLLKDGTCRNCLLISTSFGDGVNFGYASGKSITFVNNTVIATIAFGTRGAFGIYNGTVNVVNCAFFNFAFAFSGGGTLGGSNNCSDLAISFGTSNQSSKFIVNQFVDQFLDFRLKVGADCLDTGVADSVNAAFDIVGTSRPQGAAYDIGCWEFPVAATSGVPFVAECPAVIFGFRYSPILS